MRVFFTLFIFFGFISTMLSQIIEKASCSNPIPINFTVTITSNYNGQAISCNGQCDGEITVTINSGGGGAYGFQMFDGTTTITQAADVPGGGTVSTFTGLCADNYNFTVIDSLQPIFGSIFESCTEFGVIISPPNNIGVNVLGFQDPSCPDSCDGRIFANIGGGTSPLSILWIESGSTASSPTGVCTGINTVEVTDANGCFFTTTVEVNDPTQINFGMVIQPVSCDGVCDAIATSSPSGSNGAPFNFDWFQLPGNTAFGIGAAGQASFAQGSMCENISYQLRLEDSNGCPFDTIITIDDVLPLTVTNQLNVDASCANSCDGETSITISGGSGTYLAIDWYQGIIGTGTPHDVGSLSLSQNNLCPNTDYYVEIADDQGCILSIQLGQISSPPPFNFSEVHDDLDCNGDGDGLINTTLSGGTPNYNYSWSTLDGSGLIPTAADQSGLSGGTYQVIFEDIRLCRDTVEIFIFEPEPIYSNGIVSNVSCFDLTDATISITTTGGNGGYVWAWTSSPNGNIADPSLESQAGLDSATYTLSIVDALNCPYDTTIVISKPGELFFDATVTQMDCFGDNDATIVLNPANGVPNYIIDWTTLGDFNGPVSQSGLGDGPQNITLTDDNGCDKDTTISIIEPPLLTLSEINHQDITCFGDDDGATEITVLGGTPPYSIDWTGGSTAIGATLTPTNLGPGIYTITITDDNGCVVTIDVEIIEPTQLSLNITGVDLTCNGVPNGQVLLTNLSGGVETGTYDFDWDNDIRGDFDDTQDLNPVLAGTYCVNMMDDNGCTLAVDSCFTIIEPDSIFFNGTTMTDISCFGADDAVINAIANGGTESGTYGFSWVPVPACYSGPTATASISGLCEGDYTVIATDDNGCTNDTTITITEPIELVLTNSFTDVTCFGFNDGTITINVISGEPVVTVSWTAANGGTAPAANIFTPTALTPGDYQATVSDGLNCTQILSFTIDEPAPLVATLSGTDLTCNGVPDGTVTVVPSGGLLGTSYLIDWNNDATGDFDDPLTLDPILAGTYCVNIQDDNGCTLVADSCFTIIEPDSIFFNGTIVSQITCFGDDDAFITTNVAGGTIAIDYSYNWNPIPGCYSGPTNNANLSNLCEGTYTLIATDDNACTNDTTITIDPVVQLTATSSNAPTSCSSNSGSVTVTPLGGTVAVDYTITWDNGVSAPFTTTETGLPAGAYNYVVTDDNGCTVTGTETISSDTPPVITIDNITDPLCSNTLGSVEISVNSGLAPYIISYTGIAPLSYNSSNEDNFDLPAGDYSLSVEDGNGCTAVELFTINAPAPLEVLDNGVSNVDCFNANSGAINITAQGGVGLVASDYIYTWSGPNSFTSNLDDISPLAPGTYCVNISDANGCSLAADSCYIITEPTEIIIDNITPGDAQCNVASGSLSASASGGTVSVDYTYSWAGPTPGSGTPLNNVLSGSYTLTVTDDLGCQVTGVVDVLPSNGPVIDVDGFNDLFCNGDFSGSIQTTGTLGTGALSFSWTGPNGYTAGDFDDIAGLEAGTYIATLTDGAACSTTATVVIDEPDPISITANVIDANCFGENGMVDISITGGTIVTDYAYDWDNNGIGFSDNQDLDAPAGNYNVIVADDNNCTASAGPFVIDEPIVIDIVTSSTPSTCLFPAGSVTATASGGTPGIAPNEYLYSWSDLVGTVVGNNATANSLFANCYVVTVTENRPNGCVMTATECVIDNPGPVLTETHIDAICFGTATGSIDLTITSAVGVNPPVWTSTNGSSISPTINDEDINTLAADDYSVVVSDINGCNGAISVTIVEPVEIFVDASITNPTCAGSFNGEIDITPIDAVLPLTSTSWTGPNGFTSALEDINGLEEGTYCLSLIDANGCQKDTCFDITAPNNLGIITSFLPTDCDLNNGSTSFTFTGGTPPLASISWQNLSTLAIVGTTTTTLDTLGAGTYEVTITDNQGCTATASQVVSPDSGPNVTVDATNDVDCFGNLSGDIFITASGGSGGYTYSWSTSTGGAGLIVANEDQTNLSEGTYVVLVTDNSGCSISSSPILITEPTAPLAVIETIGNLDCNNVPTGSIDIVVTGGTTDYTYEWSEGGSLLQTSTNATGLNTISGLSALTYDLLVTDNNGCTYADSYLLIEADPIVLVPSFIDASCGNLDGEVSVVASGGTDGVSFTYAWTDFNTGLATSPSNLNTVPNLGQGTYQVVVTDLNGCTENVQVSVSNIGGPTVTGNETDIDCFADTDGSIDITVIGNPSFNFIWTGPNGFSSNIEDVSMGEAGIYSVSVEDINNCFTNQVFTIGGPAAPLDLDSILTHLVCFQDGQGEIDITITGGTGPYTYDWDNIAGVDDIEDQTNLNAGTYAVSVTDVNGCVLTPVSITLMEPDVISGTPIAIEPGCGLTDGSIEINPVIGGTVAVDYTYTWTNQTTSTLLPDTDNLINNLDAGNYEVIISDDNGCTEIQVIALSNVNSPAITSIPTQVLCNGGNTGAIDVTVNSIPPNTVTYTWSTADGSGLIVNDQNQTGLTAGTYNLIIDESPTGCVGAASITLTEPDVLDINSSFSTDLLCFEDNSGTIDITVIGGPLGGSYNFNWTSSTGAVITNPTSQNQTNLGAGDYQVEVTDDNGCIDIENFTLIQPIPMVITATIIDNICNGENIGDIDVTVTDGTAPYTYLWDTPLNNNNEDQSFLAAGNYLMTVTDDSGCSMDSTFVITEPNAIIFDANSSNSNCLFSDGNITTNVSGGTLTSPDYTYDWNDGTGSIGNSSDLLLRPAGSYILTVTDDNGCSADTTIFIQDINAPTITLVNIVDVDCYSSNTGSIDVDVVGVNVPLQYTWNPNGIANTEDLTNSPAGTYSIQVSDNLGCISSLGGLIIDQPDEIISSVTTLDATCGVCNGEATGTATGGNGGFTFLWSSGNIGGTETDLCSGIYSVQITDNLGCNVTENFVINDNGGPTGQTILTNDVTCAGGNNGDATVTAIGGTNPITYFWPHNGTAGSSISNLAAGTYFVQMSDSNNCVLNAQVDILEPSAITFDSYIDLSTCGNPDGEITLTNLNGGSAPLTITWVNPATGGANASVSGLVAGIYTATVSDNIGCSVTQNFNVSDIDAPELTLTIDDVLCNGDATGSITSTVANNIGTMTYQWMDAVPANIPGEINPDILSQSIGDYTLMGTDGTTGCIVLETATIEEPDALTLSIPSTQDASCDVACDGGATTIVSGGSLSYSYLWSNGETTANASNLCTGIHTVTISDANSCVIQQTVVIDENFTLTASNTPIDATCGICDGEITVAPSGGSGSYSVSWSSGVTGTSQNQLCPGLHTYLVTDNTTGCSIQQDATINDIGGPDGETVLITDATCFGDNDGTASVTVTGGTLPYAYNWLGQSNNTSNLTGVTAGTYNLQVTDGNGCLRTIPALISQPDEITISSVIQDGTCNNADGSITLFPNGGLAPYSFSWSASNPTVVVGNVDNATGLLPGTYSIEITDASTCITTVLVPLGTTNGPALSMSSNDVSCFGLTNGDATVSPVGTAPFTTTWSTGGTNLNEPNLSPGVYLVSVSDGLGCVSNASVTINEPTELVFGSPSTIDASCETACDGSATIMVSGGTLGYSYLWSGGQSTQNATGLCYGPNDVTITDANGCNISSGISIGASNNLSSTVTPIDAACGICDGEATVIPTGGSGNYTVLWFDATTGTNHTGLCAGIYPYTLTDNTSGCQTDLDVTINNIGGPDSETITITDVSCNGGTDGSADVTPSGGTLPYEYLWVPTGQTSNTLTGVGSGTYNLIVTDDNDCKRVIPVTINEPSIIDVEYISNSPTCGNSDGSIDLTVTGIPTPLTYSWNGPTPVVGSVNNAAGLSAGLYTITVTDNNGCTHTVNIPLSNPNPPVASATSTDVTCFGLGDGTGTAVGAGLDFLWSEGTIGASLNAGPGQYFVTATDPGSSCVNVISITINEPSLIEFGTHNINDPNCAGVCDGQISAIVDGGVLPYTYTWPSGTSNNPTEINLCDGITALTITDVNGCVTNDNITLTEPTIITIVVDNVVDATCVNSPDGSIDVTATGGTGTLTYAWTGALVPAFTSTNEDLTGLLPANYTLTVSDDNGCQVNDIVPVDTILIVLANAGLDSMLCINNCIVLTGSAIAPPSVTFEWNTTPSSSILSTADTVEICSSLVGIEQFVLTVSDANCTHTDTVNVETFGLPIVDAGEDIEEVLGSEQTLGGSPTGPINSTYYWTPNTNFLSVNDTTLSNPQIELTLELDYYVFVTDTNGCTNSDTIHVRPIPQIIFPNGFTPNGDGVNDDWQIDYIDQFPESVVEVYNRWGQQLFISIGYTTRWDGTYKGKQLPVGTYYYIIELNDPLFPDTYSGPITIMR